MAVTLILALSIATSILSSLPLLAHNTAGIFYALDPDVTYMGNVLSYIVHHRILFFGHPGTLTIQVLSFLLFPLRVLHRDFITWSLLNFDFLYLYARLSQSVTLGVSMAIYLSAILYAYRNRTLVIFSWSAAMAFGFLPYLGSSILPETTSFLFAAIWLLAFTHYSKKPSISSFLLISFVAGVATGNKLINIFLVLSSMGLALILKGKYITRISVALVGFVASVLGFLCSTWPVRHGYPSLFRWAVELVVSSGVHAQGKSTFVDPTLYIQSLQSFLSTYPIPSIIIVTLFAFTVMGMIKAKSLHLSPLIVVSLVTTVSILIFFKYSLSYYQLIPYLVGIYLLGAHLTNHKLLIFVSTILIIYFGSMTSIGNYFRVTTSSIKKAVNFTEFIKAHSSTSITVWEWGSSPQFALLWGQPYGEAFPPLELGKLSPGFYQITDNFSRLVQGNTTTYPTFDICWHHLYVQQSTLSQFLNAFPNRSFEVVPIPDTSPPMSLVISNHCR